jgi:hypothetical protein
METSDIEPPCLFAQECSVEEYETIWRWTRERIWKRLEVWRAENARPLS